MTLGNAWHAIAYVIAVGAVCALGSTHGAPDDLSRAETEFGVAASKARESFGEAIKKAAAKVVASFDAAIKSAATRGELDQALELRNRRAEYAAIAAGHTVWQPVSGTYSAKHVDWQQPVDMVLRDDGTFRIPSWPGDHPSDGKWSIGDDGASVSIQWNAFPMDELAPHVWFENEKLSIVWKSYASGK